MDEHLTRALYLGVTIFLLIAAFTAFFALFGGYQAYFSHASESNDFDRLKVEEPASSGPFARVMRGDEVVSLILEKRRADGSADLREIYSDSIPHEQLEGDTVNYTEQLPDIFVGDDKADMASYQDIVLTSIDPGDNYEAEFTFDSSGNTVKIDLIKQ